MNAELRIKNEELRVKNCQLNDRRNLRSSLSILSFCASLILCAMQIGALNSSANAQPASMRPPVLKDVGIDQLLNNQVPLNLEFKDENGRTVKLSEYFKDKPVVLTLAYYRCPQLCTQVLTGLLGSLKTLPMSPGKEFISLTVSFDPKETPQLAAAKKDEYLKRLNRPGSEAGWHFLTGNEDSIRALTKSVGFRYVWDPVTNQYAHASGAIIITPEGKVSRYFYGIEFAPRDLRLGFLEAGEGKIGSLVDQLILYCYQYDPNRGSYGLVMMRVMRVFGTMTLITIIALIIFLTYKTKKKEAERLKKAGSNLNTGADKAGYSHMNLLPVLLFDLPLMPEQASNFAQEVDLFYLFLIGLTAFFTIAIGAAIFIFAIKYQRRRADELPEEIEGALKLELTWTIIPFIISMFIFAWGAKLYFQMYSEPKDAMEIFVVGKQWMWRAQQPDGRREINELHVPVGRRIKLTMTSEDVIHSFYIPAFRTKTDVVPGRYTTSWFVPTKTGTYHLFCAEYCGNQHSGMIGKVVVMEPADYQTWLSGGVRQESPAVAGEKLFNSLACITCHRTEDGGRGPKLTGVFDSTVNLIDGTKAKADEAYIRESILNPNAKIVAPFSSPSIMPTFQGQVTEEQINQLIAYIKTLGTKEGEAAKASAGTKEGSK